MRAPTRAKNKAPAPMQITAEQILREAAERQEDVFEPPKQRITDPEELAAFRLRKRKGFEDALRLNRHNMNHWLRYARFEEEQREFDRARSVFERALQIDHRDQKLWLAYADMEMRNRHVNAARNVWDRAVTLLPRVETLWFRYAYMEEMLGNVAGCRAVFERWMKWEPADHAWTSYVRMEVRHGDVDAARAVFRRYVDCHQVPRAYLRWAKFEERQGATDLARAVFQAALEELREDLVSGDLFAAFAAFEQRQGEYERARVIFKYAIDFEALSADERADLRARHAAFEKTHGDRASVERVLLEKKRAQYEREVAAEPAQYDHWFDYARLEETLGKENAPRVRAVYDRAVAAVPPAPEKRLWRRYIYLWIKYAVFEEMVAQDFDRAREVLARARKVIPHEKFTFSKIWVLSAHFEVRRGRLDAARKLLGAAIGRAPKDKSFKAYIQLELQLGEIDRCRALYQKYLQWAPEKSSAWIAMADLEKSLGEHERVRAILELAVDQPLLDMPELVWKSYIDFEAEVDEDGERVRALYRRLLDRTKHVKVWLSWARWESTASSLEKSREVFQEAHDHFKAEGLKVERLAVLEAWLACMRDLGADDEVAAVEGMMPKRVKKRRAVLAEDGTDGGWEEYYDYLYPEDQKVQPSLKILEMAHQWKRQKLGEGEATEA